MKQFMYLTGYEAKKMFCYRQGMFGMILLFFAYALLTIMFHEPQNRSTIYYEKGYHFHLEQVMGSLTAETEKYMENTSSEIAQTKILLDKLYEDYYDGAMSKAEFQETATKYETILEHEKGFTVLFNQYIYVRENPENRYFMNTNGWHSLLADNYVDFLLILAVLLFIIPVYCVEYSSKMNVIGQTTVSGGGNAPKILISLLFSVLIGIFSCVFQYFVLDFQYGLDNGNFPIQSLDIFSSSTKKLTLYHAFLILSAIKVLGLVFFAFIVLSVTKTLKQVSLSLFLLLLVVVIPVLSLSETVHSSLPFPTTLVVNSSLLKGDISEYNHYTKEILLHFQEISTEEIFSMILFVLFLCILIYISLENTEKNYHLKRKKLKFKQVTFLLFTIIFSSTSCSNNNFTYEGANISFNTDDRIFYENEYFYFFVDEKEQSTPLFRGKDDEQTEFLMRSPLVNQLEYATALFGTENFVYYAYYTLDNSSFRGNSRNKVTFVQVNTDTFSEVVFFEKEIGKGITSINKWDFLTSFSSFFIRNENLFIVSDTIYQINVKTNEIDILDIPTNQNIGFDGESIYYIGERSKLFVYDLSKNVDSIFNDVTATRLYLTDSSITFENREDGNKTYSLER